MLYGRTAAQRTIDELLVDAVAGRPGALVVRGEAGIGKSALLEYAKSADARLLWVTGIESETELPFAALHVLLGPVLETVSQLPRQQSDALLAALGFGSATPADRFLIGLATLSLLTELSMDGPLLCLIDDAHWLDQESADALLFAVRRLHSEPVMLIFAARDGERPFLAPGVPELNLTGLDPTAAQQLVDATATLAPSARDHVVAEAGGNPLALLEIPRTLTPAQRAGSALAYSLGGSEPPSSRVLTGFRERIRALPDAARLCLLVAALEDSGHIEPVTRALPAVGAALTDFAPAEHAGLARVTSSGIEFRHPLIRTAARLACDVAERVAAHTALAGAVDDDRRAWHLAAVTALPDEEVAARLERAAVRARRRGGQIAVSAGYARAAELSPAAADRARRWTIAATAAYEAGLPQRATELTERASELTERAPGLAERASGLTEGASGLGGRAPGLNESASESTEGASGSVERATGLAEHAAGLAEGASGLTEGASELAERASGLAERTTGLVQCGPGLAQHAPGAEPVIESARHADSAALPIEPAIVAELARVRAGLAFEAGHPLEATRLLHDGVLALTAAQDQQASLAMLGWAAIYAWSSRPHPDQLVLARRTEELAAQVCGPEHAIHALARDIRLLLEGDRLAVNIAPHDLGDVAALPIDLHLVAAYLGFARGDVDGMYRDATRLVDACRTAGRIGRMPQAMMMLAIAELSTGRHRAAQATAAEGRRLAEDIGQHYWKYYLAGIAAWLAGVAGAEQECAALAAEAIEEGGMWMTGMAWATYALAALDCGYGRYAQVLDRLDKAAAGPCRHAFVWRYAYPDYVEAAVRTGDPQRAQQALTRFTNWAKAIDQTWALAVLHRCHALLTDGDAADLYERALRLHARGDQPFEQARTELMYGEWLRRHNRRIEARTQLQAAMTTFDLLGAVPWSERAAAELRATGISVSDQSRGSDPLASLTPQELQVVRLAATGATNREIGTQLFLSARTVGYHLYKAFPKLGVASRAELARYAMT
ncbi:MULTISPECIES: AAA family ATPase [unclassified Nocardia]|uniref:helix-turn-helix transcriptional regulator n=1 Tax=unclassified Nocardia TaxID=2637762 RepID=UPI00341FD9CF